MESTNELIILMDRAAAIAGSDYKLAQQLGTSRHSISNWRHGVAPCPVEVQALMAHIAGLDPVAELARAVVRKHEGTTKGDLLMKALGKASRLTGAVAGFVGAVALAIFSMTPQPGQAQPLKQLHNQHYDKSIAQSTALIARLSAKTDPRNHSSKRLVEFLATDRPLVHRVFCRRNASTTSIKACEARRVA